MRAVFAAATVVAVFSLVIGAGLLLGWLPPRRRRETLRLTPHMRRRMGLGYLVESLARLVWSIGSFVNSDAAVPLARWMLPVWLVGGALLVTSRETVREQRQPVAPVAHVGSLTLRRLILWVALADLAVGTAGVVWTYALQPHGIFKLWAIFFFTLAFLSDWVALAGYAFIFRWNSPFSRVQVSSSSFFFTALMSGLLLFIALEDGRALPPDALRSQKSVLVMIIVAMIGSLAWACLTYIQMLRDGGWKALNRAGSANAR